jgi:DNA damage-binding protein 1
MVETTSVDVSSRWCKVDEVADKFVVGDAFGRLAMVSLASYGTNGLIIVPLGEVI